MIALIVAAILVGLTLYRASYESDHASVVAPIAPAGVLAALALRRLIATQRQR